MHRSQRAPYLQDGKVFEDLVHLLGRVQRLELLQKVHHVVAHGRLVEVVDKAVVLEDGVLHLDLLDHGLAERRHDRGAPQLEPVLGFVLGRQRVQAVRRA